MAYRIGRDLGIPDVAAFLERTPMSGFREWVTFYQLEAELLEEARIEAEVGGATLPGRR